MLLYGIIDEINKHQEKFLANKNFSPLSPVSPLSPKQKCLFETPTKFGCKVGKASFDFGIVYLQRAASPTFSLFPFPIHFGWHCRKLYRFVILSLAHCISYFFSISAYNLRWLWRKLCRFVILLIFAHRVTPTVLLLFYFCIQF